MKTKIERLEKKLARLKTKFEKNSQPEKWQDRLAQPHKDRFYFIRECYLKGFDVSAAYQISTRQPEHAFATEEQATITKEKMLLMQEMLAFAYIKNGNWVADWTSKNQPKWGVFIYIDTPEVNWTINANNLVFGIAVESNEIAEEMLEIFGDRIKMFYNLQY